MALGNLVTVLASCLCLWFTYVLVKRHRHQSAARVRGCKAPRKYPHKDPFLGLDLFLNTGKAIQENYYLKELEKRYGSLGTTFVSKSLGSSSINSIEPQNLQAVFSTKFNDWGVEPVRLPAQYPFCGRGFITTDGAAWEHSRALLRPSFVKGNAVDLEALETHLQHVLDRIPTDGSTFDLQELLFSLYLDTATSFLFGESFDSLSGETSEEAKDFLKAFDHSMLGSGIRIALGPFKFLYPQKSWLQSCSTTHKFADQYVEKAISYRQSLPTKPDMANDAKPKNPVLLHAMAELSDDKTALRNEILQALMAAQETTAALISNVFFLLSRHHDEWQQLQDEVKSIEAFDADTLMGMTHLRHVINETLRLYPVFPQMNRVARVDTILPVGGGEDGASPIYIPAGTMFDTSWYSLHRLPSIWGLDANDFKPARWQTFKPSTWQYVPFGGGPRGCLGRVKALTEASYVIVRIIQKFQTIESRDDREWKGKVQLTAKNANGCRIALIPG